LLGRSGKALDVGAGRGIASYALAREGIQVSALEPDRARSLVPRRFGCSQPTADWPLRCRTSGGAAAFRRLEFRYRFRAGGIAPMHDLDAACREMGRVLKPGGIMFAVRGHVISGDSRSPDLSRTAPAASPVWGRERLSARALPQRLEQAGLRPIEILSPLQSEVNLFPHTYASLPQTFASRLTQIVPPPGWRRILENQVVLRSLLAIASLFDNRPGRHYSFVGHKPS
jgi:SAM-dependent methyltransferase